MRGGTPRNVRNFWLDARVDGRANAVETGPRGANGGMTLAIKVRNDGNIVTALYIACCALSDGTLIIDVEPRMPTSNTIEPGTIRIKTKR